MRFIGPRATEGVDWHGAEYRGPTTIVRAAKDPVRIPEEPAIVELTQRCFCRMGLGEDCYIVTGLTGDKRTVPYGASLEQWRKVCQELLDIALQSSFV